MEPLSGIAKFTPSGGSIFFFVLALTGLMFLILQFNFFIQRRRQGQLTGFFTEKFRDELAWAVIPAFVLLLLFKLTPTHKQQRPLDRAQNTIQVETPARVLGNGS